MSSVRAVERSDSRWRRGQPSALRIRLGRAAGRGPMVLIGAGEGAARPEGVCSEAVLLLLASLAGLALAAAPEPKEVWTSDGHRVFSHCLREDGSWVAVMRDALYRGPELEIIEGTFGKQTLVVGACDTIVHAEERAKQITLLDPWTGEQRTVETGVQFAQMVVSPDHRYLVVGGWDEGDAIAVVDIKAAEARRLDGPASYADWRFSPDGTLFWYAKSWKNKSHLIRDVDSLDKIKEDDVASIGFAPAPNPTTFTAWDRNWSLTEDIRVLTSELGVLRVMSDEKRTDPLITAVHAFKVLDDDTLLLFRQQITRSNGIAATIFKVEQARPTMLRWFVETD